MRPQDGGQGRDVLRDLASLRLERRPREPRLLIRARWWWLVAAVPVAAFGWVLVRSRAVPEVTVAVARPASSPSLRPTVGALSGSGYVVTRDRYVSIGVRVPGRVDRYFVEEGQGIRKGDPLVQLDDREYRAAVARREAELAVAQANTELAIADLARARLLQRGGILARRELEVEENRAKVARAIVQQLEADLAEARVNLEYTLLRAPSDGIVLAKLKEVGEVAVPGGFTGSGDLIRLANLDDIRAEIDVNEADLNRLRLGQSAKVTPDAYPDRTYAAEVVKLYPQVDRKKGTLKVEVRVLEPDERLLPDMSARVTFLSEDPNATTPMEQAVVVVPAASVRRDHDGRTFVWLVDGQRARRRGVDVGATLGEQVVVAHGLEVGETVIIGGGTITDGQRVSVAAR